MSCSPEVVWAWSPSHSVDNELKGSGLSCVCVCVCVFFFFSVFVKMYSLFWCPPVSCYLEPLWHKVK